MPEVICRLCLSEGKLISIFDTRLTNSEKLRMCIQLATGVEICKDDVVSKYVCENCTDIAVALYKYRTTALANDITLKKLARQQFKVPPEAVSDIVEINSDIINRLEKEEDEKPPNLGIATNAEIRKKPPPTTNFAVHPTIIDLIKTYPKLKIPNEILKCHIQPMLVLNRDDVDYWIPPSRPASPVIEETISDMERFKMMCPGISIMKIMPTVVESKPENRESESMVVPTIKRKIVESSPHNESWKKKKMTEESQSGSGLKVRAMAKKRASIPLATWTTRAKKVPIAEEEFSPQSPPSLLETIVPKLKLILASPPKPSLPPTHPPSSPIMPVLEKQISNTSNFITIASHSVPVKVTTSHYVRTEAATSYSVPVKATTSHYAAAEATTSQSVPVKATTYYVPVKVTTSHSVPVKATTSHSLPIKATPYYVPIQSAMSHSLPVKATTSHSVPVKVTTSHSLPVTATTYYVPVQSATPHSLPVKATTSHSVPVKATTSHSVPVKATTSHSVPAKATTYYVPIQSTTSHSVPVKATTSHSVPVKATTSHYDRVEATTSHDVPVEATTSHDVPVEATTSHYVPVEPTQEASSTTLTENPEQASDSGSEKITKPRLRKLRVLSTESESSSDNYVSDREFCESDSIGAEDTENLLDTFDEEIIVHCGSCDKMFNTQQQLRSHERVHRNCSLCKRVFRSMNALKYHQTEVCFKPIITNPPKLQLTRVDEDPEMVLLYPNMLLSCPEAFPPAEREERKAPAVSAGKPPVANTGESAVANIGKHITPDIGESPTVQTGEEIWCISDDDDDDVVFVDTAPNVDNTVSTHQEFKNICRIFEKYKLKLPYTQKQKTTETKPQVSVRYNLKSQIVLEGMFPELKYYRVPVELLAKTTSFAYLSFTKKPTADREFYCWANEPVISLTHRKRAVSIVIDPQVHREPIQLQVHQEPIQLQVHQEPIQLQVHQEHIQPQVHQEPIQPQSIPTTATIRQCGTRKTPQVLPSTIPDVLVIPDVPAITDATDDQGDNSAKTSELRQYRPMNLKVPQPKPVETGLVSDILTNGADNNDNHSAASTTAPKEPNFGLRVKTLFELNKL